MILPAREFRGVVLILVFRLGIKKVLVLQQAVATKGCSRGARGKWRRGMFAEFCVDSEVEVSSEALKIEIPCAVGGVRHMD